MLVCAEYPRVLVGQNWAAGYKNFSAAISGWHSEKSRWRYGVSYKSGFGHYFQVRVDKNALETKGQHRNTWICLVLF